MRYADWCQHRRHDDPRRHDQKADLVRFVRAGQVVEAKRIRAQVDAAMKVKPDLNRQSTLDQLMVDIDLLDSKNSKGKIGLGAQADWDQTLAILKNYRDLSTDKKWTDFHTNDFVPK
jgi:NitT/TauT family transport system substrate-binding protein